MLQLDLIIDIRNDGSILVETINPFGWETLCSDSETFNFHHWPSDELRCDILLGVSMGEATLRAAAKDFVKVSCDFAFLLTYLYVFAKTVI